MLFRSAYYSLQRRFFWIFLLGLLFLFKKIKSLRNFLLVCFSTFLLIFLSFSEKRNNWYLVPLMSFWSVVIALGTGWFLTFLGKWRMIKFLALFGLVSVFGYISYKTYRVNIRAIMGSQTTRSQALVAKEINKITKKDEVVIRLDHLYPTTIYYSDRKVLSSPESAITGIHFLAREDLNILIEKGEVRCISGDQKDVDKFIPPAGYVLQSLVKKEGEVLAKILKEDEI